MNAAIQVYEKDIQSDQVANKRRKGGNGSKWIKRDRVYANIKEPMKKKLIRTPLMPKC